MTAEKIIGVVRQKFFYFDCHLGLDEACPVLDTGESSISELDLPLEFIPMEIGVGLKVSELV